MSDTTQETFLSGMERSCQTQKQRLENYLAGKSHFIFFGSWVHLSY